MENLIYGLVVLLGSAQVMLSTTSSGEMRDALQCFGEFQQVLAVLREHSRDGFLDYTIWIGSDGGRVVTYELLADDWEGVLRGVSERVESMGRGCTKVNGIYLRGGVGRSYYFERGTGFKEIRDSIGGKIIPIER